MGTKGKFNLIGSREGLILQLQRLVTFSLLIIRISTDIKTSRAIINTVLLINPETLRPRVISSLISNALGTTSRSLILVLSKILL
jgi:hypothetical protein